MSVESLEVRLRFASDREHTVGKLAVVGRDFVFQYEPTFLSLNLGISPLRLPFRPGVQLHDRQGRMEVFGVFEDSLPDSWGRRLVDRHFQKTLGRPPGVLERLAYVGERAMGALTYHPPQNTPCPVSVLDGRQRGARPQRRGHRHQQRPERRHLVAGRGRCTDARQDPVLEPAHRGAAVPVRDFRGHVLPQRRPRSGDVNVGGTCATDDLLDHCVLQNEIVLQTEK